MMAAKSANDISKTVEESEEADLVKETDKRPLPATEPPKRRSYSHSVSVNGGGRSHSGAVVTRRSTAGSSVR